MILLDQLTGLLDGARRIVAVVIDDEVDLAAVHAAAVVDHLEESDLRLGNVAGHGEGSGERRGLADLDRGVGDAGSRNAFAPAPAAPPVRTRTKPRTGPQTVIVSSLKLTCWWDCATIAPIAAKVAAGWSRCGECPQSGQHHLLERPGDAARNRVELRQRAVFVVGALDREHRAMHAAAAYSSMFQARNAGSSQILFQPRNAPVEIVVIAPEASRQVRRLDRRVSRRRCWRCRGPRRRHAALRGSARAPATCPRRHGSARSTRRRCGRAERHRRGRAWRAAPVARSAPPDMHVIDGAVAPQLVGFAVTVSRIDQRRRAGRRRDPVGEIAPHRDRAQPFVQKRSVGRSAPPPIHLISSRCSPAMTKLSLICRDAGA